MDGLRALAKTFWIGGLWVIGIIVAPVLFKSLDAATAGMVAGRLFAVIAWVGLVCGVFLLVDNIWRNGVRGMKESSFWLIVGMLLCTVIFVGVFVGKASLRGPFLFVFRHFLLCCKSGFSFLLQFAGVHFFLLSEVQFLLGWCWCIFS